MFRIKKRISFFVSSVFDIESVWVAYKFRLPSRIDPILLREKRILKKGDEEFDGLKETDSFVSKLTRRKGARGRKARDGELDKKETKLEERYKCDATRPKRRQKLREWRVSYADTLKKRRRRRRRRGGGRGSLKRGDETGRREMKGETNRENETKPAGNAINRPDGRRRDS